MNAFKHVIDLFLVEPRNQRPYEGRALEVARSFQATAEVVRRHLEGNSLLGLGQVRQLLIMSRAAADIAEGLDPEPVAKPVIEPVKTEKKDQKPENGKEPDPEPKKPEVSKSAPKSKKAPKS